MTLRKNTSAGFTLLELLVVISIIGVLMAVGLASFSNAQTKARDAKRQADMKAYQNVYEQYYSQNGSYSTSTAMNVGFSGNAPTESKPGHTAYSFQNMTTTTYCVCATVENTINGNSTNNTCTFAVGGASTTFFCARQLQ